MRQLAVRFRLSLSCVRDLLRRYRLTRDVTPKPYGGGYPAKLDATRLALVRTAVEQQPDATLQELRDSLRTTAQLTVSLATMSRGLAKLGLSRKKNLSRRRAGASRHPATPRGLSRHLQRVRAR
jgi:transposase